MYQSKLIQLLKSFNPREIRRFDDYLCSPFFGSSAEIRPLWELIMPLAPDFPPEQLDRFEVFAKLGPGPALPTDAQMAQTMNLLHSKAEEFIATCGLLAQVGALELQAATEMGNRGLEKHFHSSLKRCHKCIDAFPLRDEQWHLLSYQLANIEHTIYDRANRVLRQSIDNDLYLDKMGLELDAFYLAARLRMAREGLNRQNIRAAAQGSGSLEPIWALLESSPAKGAISVQIHAKVLRMLVEPEELSHFHDLREFANTHNATLSFPERVEILTTIQNYCIRRIRLGDQSFLRHLFKLYQDALREGVLLEEGEISPWKYKNIASVGLQVGEFEWVQAFVNEFRAFLPINFRDNAFAYNLADLYYHQGEYQKALRTLVKVEFTDLVYALDTRKLQLKIFFEQRETEPMLSLFNSFRTYLNRQKHLAEETRKAYLNLVSLLNAIWKAEQDGKQNVSEAEISSTQPLVEEAWLLKMARRP